MKMRVELPPELKHIIFILLESVDTFVYTAIKNWNNLPQTIKEIKSENLFKEKVKLHLMKLSEKEENKVFL